MASNPEPLNSSLDVRPHGTPMKAHARRPELTHVLEVDGGMTRVRFHQLKATICELLYFGWQGPVVLPEVGGSEVLQSSVLLPSL
jgi:hypothetical protein